MNELRPQQCSKHDHDQWIPEGVQRPTLHGDSVTTSYDGKVVIQFPEDFRVPVNWQSMNENRNLFEQRQLEIVIPQVDAQRNEDMAFEWKVSNFTEQFMEITLEFVKPYIISKEDRPNVAMIYFWNTSKFARASDYVEIEQNSMIEVELKPQMSQSEKENLEELADSAIGLTQIISIIIIILEYQLLNLLLNQVRSLSIITHMMLISIKLPASVLVFYPKIFEIICFDLYEQYLKFDVLLSWVFNFDDEPFESEGNRFEALGYESHFMISNLSSVFVFLVINLVVQLVHFLIAKYECCKRGNKIRVFSKKQHDQFVWNGAIEFFNEVYMLICIAVAINIHSGLHQTSSVKDYFQTVAVGFNSIFTFLSLIGIFAVPIIIIVALHKYWYPHVDEANLWRYVPRITDEGKVDPRGPDYPEYANSKYKQARHLIDENQDRFGVLVKDLKVATIEIKPKRRVSQFVLINFARRLIIAFIIVELQAWAWAQLMLCMYINQFCTMFQIYNRIYINKSAQMVASINEIIILLTMYHLFCFTQFVDLVPQESVGFSLIGMTILNFIVNVLPIILYMLKDAKRFVVRKCSFLLTKKRMRDKLSRRKHRSYMRKKFKTERVYMREDMKRGSFTKSKYLKSLTVSRKTFHKSQLLTNCQEQVISEKTQLSSKKKKTKKKRQAAHLQLNRDPTGDAGIIEEENRLSNIEEEKNEVSESEKSSFEENNAEAFDTYSQIEELKHDPKNDLSRNILINVRESQEQKRLEQIASAASLDNFLADIYDEEELFKQYKERKYEEEVTVKYEISDISSIKSRHPKEKEQLDQKLNQLEKAANALAARNPFGGGDVNIEELHETNEESKGEPSIDFRLQEMQMRANEILRRQIESMKPRLYSKDSIGKTNTTEGEVGITDILVERQQLEDSIVNEFDQRAQIEILDSSNPFDVLKKSQSDIKSVKIGKKKRKSTTRTSAVFQPDDIH